jgi:hypothetical protein
MCQRDGVLLPRGLSTPPRLGSLAGGPSLLRVSYIELTHEPGRRERSRRWIHRVLTGPAAREPATDRDGGPRCGQV